MLPEVQAGKHDTDPPVSPSAQAPFLRPTSIVTGDSASMLAEACSTGKPVHIFPLPHRYEQVPGARPLLELIRSWRTGVAQAVKPAAPTASSADLVSQRPRLPFTRKGTANGAAGLTARATPLRHLNDSLKKEPFAPALPACGSGSGSKMRPRAAVGRFLTYRLPLPVKNIAENLAARVCARHLSTLVGRRGSGEPAGREKARPTRPP